MVLTRAHIFHLETLSGQKLNLNTLDDQLHQVASDIYSHMYQIIDNDNDLLTPSFLSGIIDIINNYNKEILNNAKYTEKISEMTRDIHKLHNENKHLHSQVKNKDLLNETLLTTSEEHEKENSDYKKLTDEKVKQLSLTIDSKEKEIQITNDENVAMKLEIKQLESKINQLTSQAGTSDRSTHQLEEKNSNPVPTIPRVQDVIDLERTTDAEQPSNQKTPDPIDLNNKNSFKSTTSNNCNRLFVIGDSHTKQIEQIIHKTVAPKYSVKTICLPGKNLKEIVNSIKIEKLTTNSHICVVASTNDVFKTKWNDIQNALDNLYVKCKDFQVLLVLAFPRYDIRKINMHISKMNGKIKQYIGKYKNITVLNPYNFINMQHMGVDMFHMNLKGKHTLCNKIVNKVFGIKVKFDHTYKSSYISQSFKHDSSNTYKYNRPNNTNNRRYYMDSSVPQSKTPFSFQPTQHNRYNNMRLQTNTNSTNYYNNRPPQPPRYNPPPPHYNIHPPQAHQRPLYSQVLRNKIHHPMIKPNFQTVLTTLV